MQQEMEARRQDLIAKERSLDQAEAAAERRWAKLTEDVSAKVSSHSSACLLGTCFTILCLASSLSMSTSCTFISLGHPWRCSASGQKQPQAQGYTRHGA